MTEQVDAEMAATVTAKVIRADGTEEDLGVVSVTSADADKVEKLIVQLRDKTGGPEGISLEEANARIAEESARNEAATKQLNQSGGDS